MAAMEKDGSDEEDSDTDEEEDAAAEEEPSLPDFIAASPLPTMTSPLDVP